MTRLGLFIATWVGTALVAAFAQQPTAGAVAKVARVTSKVEALDRTAFKWGPRIIDLDILLFDNLFLRDNSLQIPHPLLQERDFVLKPLCDIAPEKIHPLLKVKICDLLKELEKQGSKGSRVQKPKRK